MRILDLGTYYFGNIRVYKINYNNKKTKFIDLYEGDIAKCPTDILFMKIKSFHADGTFLTISIVDERKENSL